MALPDLISLAALAVWLGYETVLRNRNPSTLSWHACPADRGSTYRLIASRYI